MTQEKIELPKAKDLGITVAMRTRGPGGQKTHKGASTELRNDKKETVKSRAKVIVDIYASDDLKLWKLRCGRLRAWIEDIAPPYGKGGDRFLANALVDEFTSHTEPELLAIEKHKEDFLASLPHLKARYEDEAGELGNMPFPSEAELREKFSVEIDYGEPANSDDVKLVGLSEAQRDRYRDEVQQSEQRKIAGVIKHVSKVTADRLSNVVDRMDKYKVEDNGKVHGVFRDSLIDNIKEIAGLMEHWNITEDPEIDAVRRKLLVEIAPVNPGTLREDPELRKKVRKSAEECLSRVGQFGRKTD